MKNKIFYILIVVLLLLNSCDKNRIYDNNININNGKWSLSNKLKFEFNINDVNQKYNLSLYLKNNISYKYSNLYVFINLIYPDSTVKKDTLEFFLADKKGKWLGKGFGDIKISKFILSNNMRFEKKGKYTMELIQGMRDKDLNGILNVGFRVEKQEIIK
jgi:gliding motility-associated lipoprotein GldH